MRPLFRTAGSRATSLLVALLTASGCQGVIFEPGARPSPFDPPPNNNTDGGTFTRPDGMVVVPPPAVPEVPAAATRYPRISHEQWENATRDLLRLPDRPGLAETFLDDATTGIFDNNGIDLRVNETLWQNYQTAAEALATRVATMPDALARIVPAGLSGDAAARARGFVTAFGRRAFRRPLADEEITRYAALFARGAEFYPDMTDAFAAGVRLTLTAMLQSPHFLYRVERSATTAGDVIPLSGWEVATRLSFALWNTMPDDELFRAAEAGELASTDGVRRQALRLLGDDRAQSVVASYHFQLLGMSRYANVTHDPARVPEFSPELRRSLVGEANEFVRHVVFTERAGLATLLTANYSFADSRLARVHQLPGTFQPDVYTRVMFDPNRRAGLFTLTGFLASQSLGMQSHPIGRGVFITERLLCQPPPPAPPFEPLPPPSGALVTMRQRVNAYTGPGTCGGSCHSVLINPVGFAFENFDGLGRWRDQDNGQPVDARDTFRFDSDPTNYNGAVEFARAAAAAQTTHRCYVGHWLEYAYGRKVDMTTDTPVINRIASASRDRQTPVLDLLAELVSSRAFLTRSPQELER